MKEYSKREKLFDYVGTICFLIGIFCYLMDKTDIGFVFMITSVISNGIFIYIHTTKLKEINND